MTPEMHSISKLSQANRWLAELVFRLATEGRDPSAQAAAIGIGIFIGCLPIYGLHLILVLSIATLFGLSRVRMFAATWISNPLFAPVLVWVELQIGHLILHGRFAAHTISELRGLGLDRFFAILAVGSVVVGGSLGVIAAVIVLLVLPRGSAVTRQRLIIEVAARQYLEAGVVHWLVARSKLYAHRLMIAELSQKGLLAFQTIIELHCGVGIMLAAVREVEEVSDDVMCVGMDSDFKQAIFARRMLGDRALIIVSNISGFRPATADLVILRRKVGRQCNFSPRDIRGIGGLVKDHGLLMVSSLHGLVGFRCDEDDLSRMLKAEGFRDIKNIRARRWLSQNELVIWRRE